MGRTFKSNAAPLIIAHRGGAGLRPENTLAAVRHALELGVDGIEVDVHLTADGVVVVHHDFILHPDLVRGPDGDWLTGEPRPISSLTFDELQSYDVGRARPGSDVAARHPEQVPCDGERIEPFEAYLDLIAEAPGAPRLWFELKTKEDADGGITQAKALGDAACDLVEKYGLIAQTAVLAFDWRVLKHLAVRVPKFAFCYLSIDISRLSPEQRKAQENNNGFRAGFDPRDFGGSVPDAVAAAGGQWWGPLHLDATSEAVARAHELGLKVSVWTVNTPDEVAACLAAGVDGMTTDRPDILLAGYSVG